MFSILSSILEFATAGLATNNTGTSLINITGQFTLSPAV